MDVTQILSAIDAEIERLQQARQAVAALDGASPIPTPRRGRPKGSKNAPPAADPNVRKRKRNLSPEGRKRIQEAMKRRWAERHKNGGDGNSK
jgi:hypothetical protein